MLLIDAFYRIPVTNEKLITLATGRYTRLVWATIEKQVSKQGATPLECPGVVMDKPITDRLGYLSDEGVMGH